MNSLKNILEQNIVEMGLVERLSLPHIFLVLLTAFLCGLIVYLVYKFFYRGAVYSENFGLLIIMTTMTVAFIIMTISSNIVLSLGMVGALSIVRFRTAVKDPLDVGFLFLAISAGLTAGAGLFFIAGIGTIVICLIFILFFVLSKGKTTYLLSLSYDESANEDSVLDVLEANKAKLKSLVKRDGVTKAAYSISKNAEGTLEELSAIEGVKDVSLVAYTGDGQY